MKKIKANLFLNDKISLCEISYNEKIQEINFLGDENKNCDYVVSGFTDLHVHGGGGRDIMECGLSVETITKTHLKFGTTSLLATTMTAPFEELKKAFLDIAPFYQQKKSNTARILGVHLEGPFISDKKLGAQPDFTREATLKEIKELHAIVPIKVITLAPEVFNHLKIIPELNKMGIVVQIGHSDGTYEEGLQALEQGAKSFTHLFNAMSAFKHREPGIAGAALAHAQYAELIPDLLHVHPGAIKIALKCIPNLYFVTDSTAATGMPDGDYKLGSHIVHKCLGGVRLKDGTLAGSSLSMDVAFRNLLSLGLSPSEVSKRLSFIPNQLINENKRGEIKVGHFSDLLIMNREFNIKSVISEGEECVF